MYKSLVLSPLYSEALILHCSLMLHPPPNGLREDFSQPCINVKIEKNENGGLCQVNGEQVVYFSPYAYPLYYTSDLLARGFPAAF